MPVKINGASSGSVTLAAPASGSDVTLTLPAAAGTAATTAYADSAGGLQLITTQTFSAVSSVSLNNCFTATHENYVVKVYATASGNADIFMRLRLSGSDSSASYYSQSVSGSGSTPGAQRNSNVGQILVTYCPTALAGWSSIEIMRPNKAEPSTFISNIGWNRTTPDAIVQVGAHEVSTAYDGFTMYIASGTFTGTVRVYGYKNS